MKIKSLVTSILLLSSLTASAQEFQTEDYDKALWMTTRFYGAQRMGKDCNNWLLQTYNAKSDPNFFNWGWNNGTPYLNGDSYIKDADGSYDLTGGWFDCGDFALFGQTFYYSVYTLLLGYSEFADGYADHYSANYKEYQTANNYKWNSKMTGNGIPDLLDECKWATDFIMKAVKSETEFYYQKGNGVYDHKYWFTAPTKSTFTKDKGGESDGSRQMYKATGNVTSMAAMAGASLAIMARLYQNYDAAYSNECFKKAKTAYAFVKGTTKGGTDSPIDPATGKPFYKDKYDYLIDETILYAELYRLSKSSQYLTDMETAAGQWVNDQSQYDHNWIYSYAKTQDAAAYLLATIKNKYQAQGKTILKYLLGKYKEKAVGNRFDHGDYNWGYLRYIANQAFVAALDNKLSNYSQNDNLIYGTIDYIMGHNSGNQSYIVGFGNKFPTLPHHRNYYRNDCGNENNLSGLGSSYAFCELGMLVGGGNQGTYPDAIDNYSMAEGGIDYNAGLVGALGYICKKNATPKTVSSIAVKDTPKKIYSLNEELDVEGGTIEITYSDNSTKVIPMTADMVSNFNSTKLTNVLTLTVTYEKATAKYGVQIVGISSVGIYDNPKKQYSVNDPFDYKTGTIMVKYSNGNQEKIKLDNKDVKIEGFSTKVGIDSKTITIKYKGEYEMTYTIKVVKKMVSIAFITTPQKEYTHKDPIDRSRDRIKITYNDETDKILMYNNTGFKITGLSTDKVSDSQVVKVSYTEGGVTASTEYTIKIKEAEYTELAIVEPTKSVYQINEELSVEGGYVIKKYADGCSSREPMTASMIKGFDSSLGNEKLRLTVTHEGKSGTFYIKVEKQTQSISIKTPPVTGYQIGDQFNGENGYITITYNDGTISGSIPITDNMVSGFNTSEVGIHPVTITYDGASTTLYITVAKKPINTIVLDRMPDKTHYEYGEELDITGAILKINYEDGTTETMDLIPEMLDNKYNPKKAGLQTLGISFGGKTTAFAVTVEPQPVEQEPSEPVDQYDNLPDVMTPVETIPGASGRIYSCGHTIYLQNVGPNVQIISTSGQVVYQGDAQSEIQVNHPGIYIVKAGAITQKVIIE